MMTMAKNHENEKEHMDDEKDTVKERTMMTMTITITITITTIWSWPWPWSKYKWWYDLKTCKDWTWWHDHKHDRQEDDDEDEHEDGWGLNALDTIEPKTARNHGEARSGQSRSEEKDWTLMTLWRANWSMRSAKTQKNSRKTAGKETCQEVVMEAAEWKTWLVEKQQPIYVTLALVGQKRWDDGVTSVGADSESLRQS